MSDQFTVGRIEQLDNGIPRVITVTDSSPQTYNALTHEQFLQQYALNFVRAGSSDWTPADTVRRAEWTWEEIQKRLEKEV